MMTSMHAPMTVPMTAPPIIVDAAQMTPVAPPALPVWQVMRRPATGRTVRLAAVGDIGLGGRAATTASRQGAWSLFGEIAAVLHEADLAFGNLESPLLPPDSPGNQFAGPFEGAGILADAGFRVLHLANNHVSDGGQTSLARTMAAVHDAGLLPLGVGATQAEAQQLVRTDVHGLRLGWLGCGKTDLPQAATGPQYWEYDEAALVAAVRAARPEVDVLIVSVHLGYMFLDLPHPRHKAMAEALMAAGATVILMHHAHVLQGIQVEGNRVCCYNLGNCLWDERTGYVVTETVLEEQHTGAIFLFDLDAQGVAQLAILSTVRDADCRVRWADAARAQQTIARLHHLSHVLLTDYQAAFDRQRRERNFGNTLRVLAYHLRRGHWAIVWDEVRRARLEHVWQLLGSFRHRHPG